MKISIGFLILFFIISCAGANVSPDVVKFENEFSLIPEQTLTVGEELSIKFASFEENRCPKDVQCIREGELFVTLQLKQGKSADDVSATFCISCECLTKNNFPQRVVYYSGDEIKVGDETYQVSLSDFAPKNPSRSPQADLYRLNLVVTK